MDPAAVPADGLYGLSDRSAPGPGTRPQAGPARA